ncbi:glomulin-like isoform X1 [Pectinophora gossypiella]|uniref:glomulin-like isoform X1 n=1 Tax=Pectinophora gossypiella TaxID=13191 RepID=UPI00214E5620|nr:glomulin-like isoform X1 [Pectinophora gossypiella]
MEQSVDVVDLVSSLLDSGKYKEALSVPNDEKYVNSFKDNCWDLISVVIGKIQDDTIVIKPSLYGTCEELLAMIIQKSAPEEALLEFIEQIELAKNDAQFSIILQPLQQLLKKLSAKRGRSLEWCLNSISTYIETIPTPNHQLEGKERLLMDSDNNVRRITKVYTLVPPFYTPFIKELDHVDMNINTKQIITAFLISLLGKPLIHIDLDPDSNGMSEARQACTTIIQDICILEKDILKFLVLIEVCYKESHKTKSKASDDEDERTPYENRDKINMTTLSGLFYCVFSGHFQIPEAALPQVYSNEYVVHTTMLSVVHLLSCPEYGPLAKAISLCKALLNRFSSNITHSLPVPSVHYDLIKSLVNIAIYSSFESIRKNAVKLIGSHISKFDFKARCMLIKYLLDIANHSGMIGYAITLYKNSIDEAFNNDKLPECFTGAQLMNMIKKICYLPHGAESDMVELADQIITALNFLRYLAIKDTENATGIRDCFSTIETDYLEKLRTGLNMSKAHYEVKLKDIEEEKNQPEGKIEVSINVGGNILDKIPTENKKEIVNSALNAFHLIEGLVARLSECININKLQGLTMDVQ